MKAGRAVHLRRAQLALLGLLALWVAIHTVFIWSTDWSAWRLGGLGMYSQPGRRYAAAALVQCRSNGCRSELRSANVFASRIRDESLLLLHREPDGPYEPFELEEVETPGDVSDSLRNFLTFPGAGSARRLVRATIAQPCGSYLVVRYRQRVSMFTRRSFVESRPFAMSASTEDCPRVSS